MNTNLAKICKRVTGGLLLAVFVLMIIHMIVIGNSLHYDDWTSFPWYMVFFIPGIYYYLGEAALIVIYMTFRKHEHK